MNQKEMYLALQLQKKALENQLSVEKEQTQVNEIPADFNQTGWDSTITMVEALLEKLKGLREVRGKRLTPQFYRSIFNRCIIAIGEIDKMHATLTVDTDIDYASECMKLMSEIQKLHAQVEKKAAEADKALKDK